MQRLIALFIMILALIGVVSYLYWQNNIRSFGPEIGDVFPLDSLIQESGAKGLSARFYLVKYWGSWCGPCRREHPQWVSLYETCNSIESNPKVLAVIGIALESDSSSWQTALKEDQLPWDAHIVQGRDLKIDWAGRIQVQSIPENIFLDDEGLILGRNMTPSEVERFIRHRLTE
jgi:thiol-disulfide isomerase/thioredoxin